MTPADLLASAVSLITDDPDAVGLIDRASVITRTEVSDGRGGTTITETTALTDIPCLYEEKSTSSGQVAGSPMSFITHELFLIASATTRAITPSAKIVVEARDDMPERVFEKPIPLEETFGPLVHLGVALKL